MKGEDMSRRALDAMYRLNTKHCQDELERIKTNIYPDTKIDCSNCQFNNPDAKTAFLTELKALMERYNAKVELWSGTGNNPELSLYLNEELAIRDLVSDITPDNIFDYEKE